MQPSQACRSLGAWKAFQRGKPWSVEISREIPCFLESLGARNDIYPLVGIVINSSYDNDDTNHCHIIIIELLCHSYISIKGIKELLRGY